MSFKQEYASTSVRDLLIAMPQDTRKPLLAQSLPYFVRDIALYLILTGILFYSSNTVLSLSCSVVLGTVLFGLFVLGHDCAHAAFSGNKKRDHIFGTIIMLPTTWPYHVWRLSHDHHHRHLHCIEGEVAWVPITVAAFRQLGWLQRKLYLGWRSYLFFFSSLAFMLATVVDAARPARSRLWKASEYGELRSSLLITAAFNLALFGLSLYLRGWIGVLEIMVLPYLVMHAWMSIYTLSQHTHEKNRFLAAEEWTPVKAALGSTMHIRYPRLIEWLHHDINWHVPHHICARIPHYRLREAHAGLEANFPRLIRRDELSLAMFKNLLRHCRFVRSHTPDGLEWVVPTRYRQRTPSFSLRQRLFAALTVQKERL